MKKIIFLSIAMEIITFDAMASMTLTGITSGFGQLEVESVDMVSDIVIPRSFVDINSFYPFSFTVDSNLGEAYIESSDKYLYKIDIKSGYYSTVKTDNALNILETGSGGSLYGMNGSNLYRVDKENGVTSKVSSLDCSSYSPFTFTTDNKRDIAYLQSSDNFIYKINLVDNTYNKYHSEVSFQALDVAKDGAIVGITYDKSSKNNILYSIDPLSLKETELLSFNTGGGYIANTFTLDSVSDIAYLQSYDNTIYSFDLYSKLSSKYIASKSYIALDGSNATDPTVSQLAELSYDVYSSSPGGTGGYDLLIPPNKLRHELVANVYSNSDNSQIVIAIRGTDNTKNLLGDMGLESTADGIFNDYVDDVANLIQLIHKGSPDSKITLTGHSLGGALAQLLGTASGLDTVAFDAPGVYQIYEDTVLQLKSSGLFGKISKLGSGNINTNYRAYGDQVSLVGKQISSVITVGSAGGPVSALDISGIGEAHKISSLANELSPNKKPILIKGIIGPNYIPVLTNMVASTAAVFPSATVKVATFMLSVEALAHYYPDPYGFESYVFEVGLGSPFLYSLSLPNIEGVDQYKFRYKIGDTWSLFEDLSPLNEYLFSPEVNGFEFDAIDKLGNYIKIADNFWFDVSFSSSGMVSATLTETNLSNSDPGELPPVPEPATVFLFAIGLAGLTAAGRKK